MDYVFAGVGIESDVVCKPGVVVLQFICKRNFNQQGLANE